MAIKSIVSQVTGLSGVVPSIIYIDTDNTLAEVTAAGFLNDQYQTSASPLSEAMMAVVTTKITPSATSTQTRLFNLVYTAGLWSLVPVPQNPVVAVGKYTFAGGPTNIAIPVGGVLPTDYAFAVIQNSTNTSQVISVQPSLNFVTVFFSANPGNSIITYQVIR